MTVSAARRAVVLAWSEAELQSAIVELARTLGYLAYHTYDSRRSVEGFPDLVLAHERTAALVMWELKREDGPVSDPQRRWLHALRLVDSVGVVRPSDWLTGQVEQTLRRLARGRVPS